MTLDDYRLSRPESEADWDAYHRIRRTVLFEARGRFGVYDPLHSDEFLTENRPLLLFHLGGAIGTVRLDFPLGGIAYIRLLAIVPEKQKRGHGRVLLALLERQALELGATVFEVNSANDSIGFYEKASFSLVHGGGQTSLLHKPLA